MCLSNQKFWGIFDLLLDKSTHASVYFIKGHAFPGMPKCYARGHKVSQLSTGKSGILRPDHGFSEIERWNDEKGITQTQTKKTGTYEKESCPGNFLSERTRKTREIHTQQNQARSRYYSARRSVAAPSSFLIGFRPSCRGGVVQPVMDAWNHRSESMQIEMLHNWAPLSLSATSQCPPSCLSRRLYLFYSPRRREVTKKNVWKELRILMFSWQNYTLILLKYLFEIIRRKTRNF